MDVAYITGMDTEVNGITVNNEIDLSNTLTPPPIIQHTLIEFKPTTNEQSRTEFAHQTKFEPALNNEVMRENTNLITYDNDMAEPATANKPTKATAGMKRSLRNRSAPKLYEPSMKGKSLDI